MRKLAIVVALSALVAGAYADIVVGNGKIETESRKLGVFSSVSFSGAGILRVHKGAWKVDVTSDSNVLPYISTEVSGGDLKIGVEPFNSIMSFTKLQIDVSMPALGSVAVAGSGDA